MCVNLITEKTNAGLKTTRERGRVIPCFNLKCGWMDKLRVKDIRAFRLCRPGYPHSLFFFKKGVQTIASIPDALLPVPGRMGLYPIPVLMKGLQFLKDKFKL
jgi:hypothetical protein